MFLRWFYGFSWFLVGFHGPPPEAPVTAHEAERAAMIYRRRHFMATLMDQPLTEETLAAARAANIFIG